MAMDDWATRDARPRVLVAEDESSVRERLSQLLVDGGFECAVAQDGVEAVKLLSRFVPDAAVLDVMMPKMDGYDVCECARGLYPDLPVMFLTAKGDIDDRKTGYRVGADDYMTKPFDDEELMLRVRALVRRGMRLKGALQSEGCEGVGQGCFTRGSLVFDERRLEVEKNGVKLGLTPREFQVLALLARVPGEVCGADEIVEAVWGADYDSNTVSIPVYVRRIREKIEDDPSHPAFLRTVRYAGYLFAC